MCHGSFAPSDADDQEQQEEENSSEGKWDGDQGNVENEVVDETMKTLAAMRKKRQGGSCTPL